MSTNKTKYPISKEIKEQILKRIKEEGISIGQAAQEHGVSERSIYGWLAKGITKQPSFLEVAKLKKRNQELLALVGELTVKLSQAQKKI